MQIPDSRIANGLVLLRVPDSVILFLYFEVGNIQVSAQSTYVPRYLLSGDPYQTPFGHLNRHILADFTPKRTSPLEFRQV